MLYAVEWITKFISNAFNTELVVSARLQTLIRRRLQVGFYAIIQQLLPQLYIQSTLKRSHCLQRVSLLY